ncbi:hypothetical protein [Streptomyces sp. CB01881]|uniref:hypothetical protein n=1 Tax=Streptomyces sp. CB01881 TaxID=2078691 RepID=UPI000CDBF03C|nr:hypothetical protein [Streptomyces sp. CB01881]AUY51948.1 hypothetical protein C2142_26935 [Streptomyces sp. CB01881]TYC71380.1 hypothetical protein EH183_26920 [Streptomyces sp. CB01881]
MSANALTAARTSASGRKAQQNLRRFLALDAVVSGGNGLAYLAFSGPLGDLLGVGGSTLVELGAVLAVFGLAVGVLAARRRPARLAVQAVIDVNVVWAVLSLVAMGFWLEPSTAGLVWIPAQAGTVALFAVLQFTALRGLDRGDR